jgi:hypothetical protein
MDTATLSVARGAAPGATFWMIACRPAAALLVLAALSAGCIDKDFLRMPSSDLPPTGPVVRLDSWWESQVHFTPDSLNSGQQIPGLAGRLYLYGESPFPVKGDCHVIVDLFNDSMPGAPPVQLERWYIHKVDLERLLRKDKIGWGYTLFLPWATYRPDITCVRLKIAYDRKGGALYFETPPLHLNMVQDVEISSKSIPLGVAAYSQNAPVSAGNAFAPAATNAPAANVPQVPQQGAGMTPGMRYPISATGNTPTTGYPTGTGAFPSVVSLQANGPGAAPAAGAANAASNALLVNAQPNWTPVASSSVLIPTNGSPAIPLQSMQANAPPSFPAAVSANAPPAGFANTPMASTPPMPAPNYGTNASPAPAASGGAAASPIKVIFTSGPGSGR